MISVAVVILNYNGKSFLEKFLPIVVENSGRASIIVADNGSTDDSINFIKTSFPSIQLIDNGANLGFCGGYNKALSQIKADIYVLLNNDVEVTPGWLDPVIELMSRDSDIVAVQPKILSHHNKKQFEYAGAAGGMIDTLGYPFCRGRIFNEAEEDHGQYNDITEIFWATGACLFIRSESYHAFNGLDEDFFAHMEEIDLCWKLKRAGKKIYYAGSSTVYHVGGGTLAATNPRKTYYNFRNGVELLLKHFSFGDLLWKFPLRILLDWVAALRFLLGSPANAWAVLRAHGGMLSRFGATIRKRRHLKRVLGTFYTAGIYKKLIIVDFFLQGKKKWTDMI